MPDFPNRARDRKDHVMLAIAGRQIELEPSETGREEI
jgi:hypothetical protein